MKKLRKIETKLQKLSNCIKGKSSLVIVIQDNPDPDSIAAAIALRKIVNRFSEIHSSIVHKGTIGRGENRALVKYLNLNFRENINISKYNFIAMVDAQPGTGNTCLPNDIIPDIVIDHHPVRKITRKAEFTDIRKHYGATSTIMFEYLTAAGIDIDTKLATALLYGIRSDTQDMGRETCQADIEAMTTLFPKANKRKLGEIQQGSVPRAYFKLLSKALLNTYICGHAIYTNLGDMDSPI